MKLLLPFFLFIFFLQARADGFLLSITSTEPASTTVCGSPQTFTVDIDNPSPFLLTNVSLTVTMPSGMSYSAGSITGGTEANISSGNAPIFSLANIPSHSHVKITFNAIANCDIIAYVAAGNLIKNHIQVNYTGNSTKDFDQVTTPTYVVKQPLVSITTVTNQSYTGNIGDGFTRCITIQNSGLGELSQFVFTDTHGAGIQVLSVDKGTLSNSGTTETITLNGSDFNSIGNGNSVFETNETITICEKIYIQNCQNTSSDFEAKWGCYGKTCQSSLSSANVVFANMLPNIVVVGNDGLIYGPTNPCLGPGHPTKQKLMVTNNGTGKAINVQLDIFHSTGGATLDPSLGSNLDPSSFMVKHGVSGTPVSITPDSTQANQAYSCLSASPKGRAWITIPVINPGDTLYYTWDTYSCCEDRCSAPSNNTYINSWLVAGKYTNLCMNKYLIPLTWGHVYQGFYGSLTNDNSPTVMIDGHTGTFNFLLSNYYNTYTKGTNPHWKIEYTLPPCLSYSGNLQVISGTGQVWSPLSVNAAGTTVTANFGDAPFDLTNATLALNLSMACAGCGAGHGTVSVKITYTPDAACGCEIPLACQAADLDMICGAACTEGISFQLFEMKRTSYGFADNNNDGLPDVSGSLDFSKIRTDRAMFGDTIISRFNGLVLTSAAHPTWDYCYVHQSLDHGNLLSFLDAQLKIYQASSGKVFTCSNFTPVSSTTGTVRDFVFDLSAPTLISAGCLPAGFTFSKNDSVLFRPRYKVTTNVPQAGIIVCKSTNEFYVSNIANPVQGADKYECNPYPGDISLITYFYNNCCQDAYNVSGCNAITINQYYYLSVGKDYWGGNIFPYEYRQWAHIKKMKAILPPGYHFISASFQEYRTAGTGIWVASPVTNVTPQNSLSDTLIFDMDQVFTGAGAIPLSDDGFGGYLNVVIEPSCKVKPYVASDIEWDWEFAETGWLKGSATPNVITGIDKITFSAPGIFIQSLLPSVVAPDKNVSWDVTLSNATAIDANNVWLSAPKSSGVSIFKIYDLDKAVNVPDSNAVYRVGVLAGKQTRTFRVTGTYTSCDQDSILLFAGWNCIAGYPVDVAHYPCNLDTIKLKLTPQIATMLPNITSSGGTINLCDTAYYTVNGINVQLGTAYDLKLQVSLPIGVSIVHGTSKLSYPVSSPFISISDPVFLSGTTWQWNLSTIDSLIDSNGLKGILQPSLNSVITKFGVIADCNYTSGNSLGINFVGHSTCGAPISKEKTLSPPLTIKGASKPYQTDIKMNTSYFSPCANSSTLNVTVINIGPQATTSTDSVTVLLPGGVIYSVNSFTGIHQPPVNTIPYSYMLNGQQYLIWKLPAGILAGDSIKFSFNYQASGTIQQCNITNFFAHTSSTKNGTCIKTGSSCNINVFTGDTVIPVFTYKAYLAFSNASATSVPDPPTGESVTLNMNITNTGEAILPKHKSLIQFYYDSNNNGVYNTGDVFIGSDSLFIGKNSTITYSHTLKVAAGMSCSIIAIADTSFNACICTRAQILFNVPLTDAGPDKNSCSGNSVQIGFAAVNSYTYAWSPATKLSDPTISNPFVSSSNNTNVNDTLKYVLTTQRGKCTTTDTVLVILRPSPTANAGPDTALCAGGAITLHASGGTKYKWSPATGLDKDSISNPVATPSSLSNYTVTITDANGCSAKDSLIVKVNPLPLASAGKDTTICYGQNAVLNGSATNGTPAYSFNWNNGSATTASYTITPLSTSSYTFVVTDSKGCTSLPQQVKVNVGGPFSIKTVPVDPICHADSVKLLVSGSGGNSSYTFSWMPGNLSGSSITVSPATSVTYTVTLTDGCGTRAVKDSMRVNVFSKTVAVVSADTTICSGTSITLHASGGASYSWTPALGLNTNNVSSPVATPAISTSYIVTITDVNGCKAKDSVKVNVLKLPLAAAGKDTTICYGQTAVLNGSATNGTPAYSFNWNNGSATTPSYTVTPLSTSSYTLVVTDSKGCISAPQNVTVNAGSPLSITVNAPAGPVCVVDPIVLKAKGKGGNGSYTFIWMPGNFSGDSITIPPNTAKSFTVTLKDGCGTIQVKDSVKINIVPQPIAAASADTSVCAGTSATLQASGGISYSWTPSSGLNNNTIASPVATPSQTTLYTVMVTDVNGCKAADSVKVKLLPLPVASAGKDTVICLGQTIQLQATGTSGQQPYSYLWNNSKTGISFSISPSKDTLWTLVIKDANGCVSTTDSVLVSVNKPLIIDASAPASLCLGDSIKLTASASGGNNHYSYNWMPGNINASSLMVTPAATTTYTVVVKDGCTVIPASVSIPVTVNPLPTVNFTSVEKTGCVPLCVNFNDLSSIPNGQIVSRNWDFGNGINSVNQNPQYCYLLPGIYSVSETVTSDKGCKTTLVTKDMITVYAKPDAAFSATPAITTITLPLISFSDASTGVSSWLWNFGDPQDNTTSVISAPYHVYRDTGTYVVTLIVQSDKGCADTALNVIHIIPETSFYTPNAFSPNGDGLNDEFFVKGSFIQDIEMYIFDRWGMLIYQGHGPNARWNGIANGGSDPAQEDVYVYKIYVTDLVGKKQVLIGRVTIIK